MHSLPSHIISRFAPSPTGPMHLGNLISAIYVWGLTKLYGGHVILRIEDHDQQRSKPEWKEMIMEDLEWLGLHPDSISLQSEHPQRFQEAADTLIASKLAFTCECTRKMLLARQDSSKQELYYNGECRHKNLNLLFGNKGDTNGIRFQVCDEQIPWNDHILGPQLDNPHSQCGDFLIRDRKGNWTYQFAVVVDDIYENVNFIIRGQDLRDSTARQIQLYKALHLESRPHFYHHPLLHEEGSDQKLSKRTRSSHLRNLSQSPEDVLGIAAYAAGLQTSPSPIHSSNLAALFQHL